MVAASSASLEEGHSPGEVGMEIGQGPTPLSISGRCFQHRQAGRILIQPLAQLVGEGFAVGAGLGEEHPVTA
jgi:hypothetical protein